MRPPTSTSGDASSGLGGLRRRRSPSSVTRMSMSLERRRTARCVSTPILLESASTTTCWRARPTIARLVAASSRSGVDSPWLDGDAVGAEEGDVGAEVGAAPRRSRPRPPPGWWRRTRPGQQVQLDRGASPASRAATGTAWVTHGQPVVAGEQARRAGRSCVPASRTTVRAGRRAAGRGRRGRSRSFWLGVGAGRGRGGRPRSAVSESAGTAPPCTRRTRPQPLERGQVAAHGLGGDVELAAPARPPRRGRAG